MTNKQANKQTNRMTQKIQQPISIDYLSEPLRRRMNAERERKVVCPSLSLLGARRYSKSSLKRTNLFWKNKLLKVSYNFHQHFNNCSKWKTRHSRTEAHISHSERVLVGPGGTRSSSRLTRCSARSEHSSPHWHTVDNHSYHSSCWCTIRMFTEGVILMERIKLRWINYLIIPPSTFTS